MLAVAEPEPEPIADPDAEASALASIGGGGGGGGSGGGSLISKIGDLFNKGGDDSGKKVSNTIQCEFVRRTFIS